MTFDPQISDIVIGDSLRLGQILTNLVSNAVKFTPEGRIDLIVKRGEEDSMIFEVIDTGIAFSRTNSNACSSLLPG